jgi:predicted acetyltransferase
MEPRKGFCARYVAPDGTLEGYVVCEGKMDAPDMRHRGVLTVNELISSSDRAYRALWKFCTDVDLLSEVHASNRAVGEPIGQLFNNARAAQQIHVHDFIWIRILNVVAALEGRSYDAFGRIVLEVTDPLSIAPGRYELTVDADGVRCSVTTAEADIGMPISTLGAIYAGDMSLLTLATAGKLDVINPSALQITAAMFLSPSRSWCATWF